jgi:hypothetical protein
VLRKPLVMTFYRCRKEESAPEIIPDAGAIEKLKRFIKLFKKYLAFKNPFS